MSILVNDEAQTKLSSEILSAMEAISVRALTEQDMPKDAEISLTLCDDAIIHQLNKKWRNVDAPTDVLSFPMYSEEDIIETGELLLLGDIVISLERAAQQAQDYDHSLEREILFLFTHGVLHLLGYDHESEEERQEMRTVEEELLQMVGAVRDGL